MLLSDIRSDSSKSLIKHMAVVNIFLGLVLKLSWDLYYFLEKVLKTGSTKVNEEYQSSPA